MRILVTGASGFLGRAVCRRLRAGHAVVGVAHRHAGPELQNCDIRDAAAFEALLREVAPDVVVYSAAYREPDYCEEHPIEAERLNVAPMRVLARVLPPRAHLIAISSDYVFDGGHPPYLEDAFRNPINVYGQTKVAAEDAALTHPGGLVVRIPVLVGAGPTLATSGYIGQLVTAVRERKPLTQDHVLVRVPTWIDDVAHALDFLITQRALGVMHVSGPRAATRYESALDVAHVLGLPHDHIRPSDAVIVRPAPRPVNAQLATTRLRALGYTRATDFVDVVRDVLRETA